MTASKHTVVLFEDDPNFGLQIEKTIRKELPTGFCLVRFSPKTMPKTKKVPPDEAYEDRIRKEFLAQPYKDAALIVSDRDLSRTGSYPGLSEAVISKIAAELGIPICLYARGVGNDQLERLRNWSDSRIILDSSSPEHMANQIAVIATGFLDVTMQLTKTLLKKGKARPTTPAAVMAHVLGYPESTDTVSLYGSGDQKMAAEILPYAQKGAAGRKNLEKRLPCLFGYWLYDSILRYPGLLVNEVAAASYLNIDVDTFQSDTKIRRLFASAVYKGPFHDKGDVHWWRSKLDDLLADAGCEDGCSLVEKRLKRKIKSCQCSIDPKRKAGWYCMVTKKPVSLQNSRGNISWFPQGADLARINKKDFEQIGPWLGLF